MSSSSQFLGGGSSIQLWVSGSTVTQLDYRKSPIDGEIYQRTAATGGGTTDPANDNTNYVAASYARVSALPQRNEIDNGTANAALFFNGSVKTTVGAITAGVRTQILSISSRGACGFLGFFKNNSGGGLVEIISDGLTIMSYNTSTTNANCGHVLIGAPVQSNIGGVSYPLYTAISDGYPVQFRRTFVVWYTPATSASGANATIGYDIKTLR